TGQTMKVKVIKRAEIESLGEQPQRATKRSKRRRIAEKVEKWVADIRRKSDAESRISLDELFHAGEG
ncbi:MAG TPA: hypothetical protein VL501_09290, partial [Pyrinomonadaceae bacterium]|nr:hypothetical protein [Pyrinomonadaceae bacterium]